MKKKDAVVASVAICLAGGVAWAAAAVMGSTSITMKSVTKKGGQTGPWSMQGSGNASLDSSVKAFIGIQFSVTDPNKSQLPDTQIFQRALLHSEALLCRGVVMLTNSRCRAITR